MKNKEEATRSAPLRIRLHFRHGRLMPVNPKLDAIWNAQLRERRIARAGAKLARIDYTSFREPRYSKSDLGTMARIPDTFISAYLRRYNLSRRGVA